MIRNEEHYLQYAPLASAITYKFSVRYNKLSDFEDLKQEALLQLLLIVDRYDKKNDEEGSIEKYIAFSLKKFLFKYCFLERVDKDEKGKKRDSSVYEFLDIQEYSESIEEGSNAIELLDTLEMFASFLKTLSQEEAYLLVIRFNGDELPQKICIEKMKQRFPKFSVNQSKITKMLQNLKIRYSQYLEDNDLAA